MSDFDNIGSGDITPWLGQLNQQKIQPLLFDPSAVPMYPGLDHNGIFPGTTTLNDAFSTLAEKRISSHADSFTDDLFTLMMNHLLTVPRAASLRTMLNSPDPDTVKLAENFIKELHTHLLKQPE